MIYFIWFVAFFIFNGFILAFTFSQYFLPFIISLIFPSAHLISQIFFKENYRSNLLSNSSCYIFFILGIVGFLVSFTISINYFREKHEKEYISDSVDYISPKVDNNDTVLVPNDYPQAYYDMKKSALKYLHFMGVYRFYLGDKCNIDGYYLNNGSVNVSAILDKDVKYIVVIYGMGFIDEEIFEDIRENNFFIDNYEYVDSFDDTEIWKRK